MKRKGLLALVLAGLLCLTGCSEGVYPDKALDGTAWDKSWTMLGSVLGMEDLTKSGFTQEENPVVLTGDDTFYATWSFGEGQAYVNAEGKDATLYDAQLYILLYGCGDEASAEDALTDWTKREEEVYTVTRTEDTEVNGISYSILSYEVKSEDNPYHHGAVAFGMYENYAVSVELTCAEGIFADDADSVLLDLLSDCHYSADYHFDAK